MAASEVGSRRASLEREMRALMAAAVAMAGKKASQRMETGEKPYEAFEREGRMGLR